MKPAGNDDITLYAYKLGNKTLHDNVTNVALLSVPK